MHKNYPTVPNRKETIISERGLDEFEKISKQPFEMQRFQYYTGKIDNISIEKIVEDDEKIYYVQYFLEVRIGKNSLYLQKTSYYGATYRKTGKANQRLKIWKKGPAREYFGALEHLFKYTNNEWVMALPQMGKDFITAGLAGMIIKGNISNPREYFKYVIKYCLRQKISAELLYQACKRLEEANDCWISPIMHNAGSLRNYLKLATNPDQLLEMLTNKTYGLQWENGNMQEKMEWSNIDENRRQVLTDMMPQALALNKKINFKWSPKRMEEVHQEWTSQMTELELEFVPNTKYNYQGELEIPSNWKLISSSKELFKEGTDMHHCVYSREFNVEGGFSFIFHINNLKSEKNSLKEVTLEIKKTHLSKEWGITGLNGRYNQYPEDTRLQEKLEEIIENPKNQKYFEQNSSRLQNIRLKKSANTLAKKEALNRTIEREMQDLPF